MKSYDEVGFCWKALTEFAMTPSQLIELNMLSLLHDHNITQSICITTVMVSAIIISNTDLEGMDHQHNQPQYQHQHQHQHQHEHHHHQHHQHHHQHHDHDNQVNEGFLQQLSDLDYKLNWAREQAEQAGAA